MTDAATAIPSSLRSCQCIYDVFLSFRGEDTRNNFAGHLYNSLDQQKINVFMDDEKLRRGEEITPALLKAIEQSRIAIIIFSKNYASSTHCLGELVHILDHLKRKGRFVLPVFYDVDPSDVRYQRGTFGESFTKHEERFYDDKGTVQKWRKALNDAANLSGWCFRQGSEPEYKFIRKIIEEVSKKIDRTPLHITNYRVGADSPMPEVTSLLGVECVQGVNMLRIYKTGGISKITIARDVYHLIGNQFDGASFLADIREKSIKQGLDQLQETSPSEILGENISVGDVSRGISIIKKRLHRKWVLLILDDVDELKQLKVIAGNHDWFGSCSRIIITTRDKHLLATPGVDRTYEDFIQDMGREIVRQKSTLEPSNHSRLRFDENIVVVLEENTGIDKIEVIEPHMHKGLPCAMSPSSLEYRILGLCASIESSPDILAEMGNMTWFNIELKFIKKVPYPSVKIDDLEEPVLTSCASLEGLPSNNNRFQNIKELDAKGCPQLAKLLAKSLVDWIISTDRLPKLNCLILEKCDLSDDDLETIIRNFPKLKWLVLSDNSFLTTIPEGIEDLSNLLFLRLDNCKQLRNIFVVPPHLQYIDARNCISLTPWSADVLLNQAFQEVAYMDIIVPRTEVPNWFDHCSKGESVTFWVRRRFPTIAIFFLLGGENETSTNVTCEFSLLINGLQVSQEKGEWPVDHVWLFDMRTQFSAKELLGLNEHLHSSWNQIEIKCTITSRQQNVVVKCCGIHLYKDRMNIHDVSFISPNLHNSGMAYNINDLDIYDEGSKDVVFSQVLAKYDDRRIVELMERLQNRKKKEGDGYGNDDHLELDIDTTVSEEERHLTFTHYQNPESCEVGTKNKGKAVAYSKPEEKQKGERLSPGPYKIDGQTWDSIMLEGFRVTTNAKGGAEQKPLVASINGKELMIQKEGKLKEDSHLMPSSTVIASLSTDRGEQGKGPLYVQASQDIIMTKSKQSSTKSNAEARIPINENQAQTSQPQFQESRANQESVAEEAEGGLIATELYSNQLESTIIEDNMEAFYASLEAETPTLSLHQDTQTNTLSVSTSPSEETQKALQNLRDFVSKKFPLLLHPGRSGLIKSILEYLVSLSPDDGISLRTKSVIMQLSRSFTRWSLDYHNASLKLESAAVDLSKVEELKGSLEANVKEFRVVETLEHGICSELDYLQERKRELEEEINAIKAKIADVTLTRETVANRKRAVFDNGRVLKAQRDDLRNRVPSLRAEQEWAKITQANIENEWSKLGEQFIESSWFEE